MSIFPQQYFIFIIDFFLIFLGSTVKFIRILINLYIDIFEYMKLTWWLDNLKEKEIKDFVKERYQKLPLKQILHPAHAAPELEWMV